MAMAAAAAAAAAGAVELPSPDFPGPSAEASHASWPGGRQPRSLESWPRRQDGAPEGCWHTEVLQDMHLGWPAKCGDLHRTSAVSSLECHESCTRDPLCAVWQYNYMTQCWQGLGYERGQEEWKGSDLLATGAQRLQHGEVAVLMDFRGWEIRGLHDIGDTSWGSGNHTAGAANCRAWCYSNLRCQYWQYAPGSCRVEDPTGGRRPVEYPLVLDEGASQKTAFAHTVLAGEYIAHTCPPAPPTAAPTPTAVADPELGLQWCLDGVSALLFTWALVKVWVRFRGVSADAPLLPDPAGAIAEADDALGAACGARTPMRQLRRWTTSLLPTPVETLIMPGHLDRLLHTNYATASERKAVCRIAPEAPPSYANYLAWRRTFTAALFLLGLVSYAMQCRVLFSTWRHHLYFADVGARPEMATYQAWVTGNPANPSFIEYSRQKVMALLAGILGEVLRGSFFIDAAVCTLEIVPLVCLCLAISRWTSFSASRRLIINAWRGSFLLAFVVSLFPVRLMLSFSSTELRADQYVHELAVALNLDKAQDMLLGGCEQIDQEHFAHRIEIVGDTLKTTCTNLGRFPLELAVPCIDSLDLCHINLGQALDGCKEAVQQFEVGHVERATRILQRECGKIREAFVAPSAPSERQNGKSKAFKALVDMMRIPFHAVVPSVELVSLTISALHASVMVLPSVLGIAPGFMAAGFATKVLAPHSCLPGAVITIVPIVLASMGWIAHTVLFQYVSHPWTLALLTIFVLQPLVFIWLSARFRLTLPVTQATLRQAAQASTVTHFFLVVVAALLAARIAGDFTGGTAEAARLAQLLEWCHVDWARLGLGCAARTLYSFALTFFGVADWMISDVAVQQRYWRTWAQLGFCHDAPQASPCLGQKTASPWAAGGRPAVAAAATSAAMSASPACLQRLATASLRAGREGEGEDEYLADLLRHRDLLWDAGVRSDGTTPLAQWGADGGDWFRSAASFGFKEYMGQELTPVSSSASFSSSCTSP